MHIAAISFISIDRHDSSILHSISIAATDIL